MAHRAWRDRLKWGRLFLVGSGAVVVAWAFLGYDDPAPFPNVLIGAQGAVVTALVFFLSLARSQHERNLDRVVSAEQEQDAATLKAHLEHPDAMSNVQLRQIANVRSDYLSSLARLARRPLPSLLDIPRQERKLGEIDDIVMRLEDEQRQLDHQLYRAWDEDRPTGDASRQLQAERRDLDARLDRAGLRRRSIESDLGGRRTAPRVLRPRLTDPLTTSIRVTARAMLVAQAMLLVMAVLYGVAAGITDARPTWTPAAEWWAMTLLLGVGIVYAAVVSTMIDMEDRRAADQLERLPLIVLHKAEGSLPYDKSADPWWEPDARRVWNDHAERFAVVANTYPHLSWVRSLRGRDLLWQALSQLESIRRRPADPPDELKNGARPLFRAARRELSAASEGGDLFAMVALACALEQSAVWQASDLRAGDGAGAAEASTVLSPGSWMRLCPSRTQRPSPGTLV